MKEAEARKLVDDTFTRPYDEARLRVFVRNLFHEYERLTEKASAGQYIPDAFKRSIVSYKRLAKFTDPQGMRLDVLSVKLPSRRALENARTMQRNFIARYLNGSRGGALKDAALVGFYADDSEDWRFSLVRMDYVLDEEKQKIKKALTPARRYSFLVGTGEKTHTAHRQLLPILQSPAETTLTELENAFNIETVTNEFFRQYKALYLSLKAALDRHIENDETIRKEFTARDIETAGFAKRLLGQLVFLYFLQKKGWLGVARGAEWGTGPKDFLQRLYRDKNYHNFFNDVLEHLFYDALATERQTQDHYFPRLECKIPFLNGGLFEPFKGYAWDGADILLDDKIFADIFAVFDLYNFTVREDEPLDKEVAVDPEMLGKVFENLIPENERKGSGTFYTPREIVHYMCQESLVNYLDAALNISSRPAGAKTQQALFPGAAPARAATEYEDAYTPRVAREDIAEFIYHGDTAREHDATAQSKNANGDYRGGYRHKIPASVREHAREIDAALAGVKICDPAIGSGAFPVGAMNEIVRARAGLNTYLGEDGRAAYDFKRHAIQESIYGVDIDPSAVDIAKLRLWLSLIVDEEDFGTIKPLPNLEYKIMAGDSLMGLEKDLFNNEKFSQLETLKDKYFDETRPSEKLKLKSQIENLINDLAGAEKRFDYEIYFSEVFRSNGGFDIVIANPPYLEARSREFRHELKVKYQNAIKSKWLNSYGSIPRGSDLMIYFYPKALEIIKRNGCGCFITENSWLDTDYGSKFQKFMLENSDFRAIIDSKCRYFSGKNAPNINTVISIFSPRHSYQSGRIRFIHVNDNIEKISQSLSFMENNLRGIVEAKTYSYGDRVIRKFKWGFLFQLPEWFFPPLEKIEDSLTNEASFLDFGQGLNIASEYVLPENVCGKLNLDKDAIVPFFRKGSAFCIESTKSFLVNYEKITDDVDKQVKNSGFKCFDFSGTRKIPAKFIMPRGIGRHFCALNHIEAFSYSYVEIYPKGSMSKADLMSVWAYCNSSVFWLMRELSGRKNLGGGMLKAEASDVSRLPIPYKKLNPFQIKIEQIFKQCKSREPAQTKEEIFSQEHKLIDRIVAEALSIKEYEDQIRDELLRQIAYRQDKSVT